MPSSYGMQPQAAVNYDRTFAGSQQVYRVEIEFDQLRTTSTSADSRIISRFSAARSPAAPPR